MKRICLLAVVLIGVLLLAAPASAELVALYHFDEVTGTTTPDSSGKGNTGTLTAFSGGAVPVLVEPGKYGKALQFGPSYGFVSVTDPGVLSSLDVDRITAEAWIYLDTAPTGDMNIVRKGPWDDRAFGLDVQNAKIRGFVVLGGTTGGATIAYGSTSLPVGQWTHVAMTYDGAKVQVYVKGELNGSSAGVSGAIGDNDYAVTIGGQRAILSGGALAFKGKIDEVRIWNQALTADQIKTSFNLPVANPGSYATIHVGTPVTLSGSGSTDPSGFQLIKYDWTVTDPDNNISTYSGMTAAFTPTLTGNYTVALTVTNEVGLQSPEASVPLSTSNTAPIADAVAAPGTIEHLPTTVQLDALASGNASSDPDGDEFTFHWELTKPDVSTAALNNPDISNPTFTADKYGDYVASLVVTDSWGAKSTAKTVNISSNNLPPTANPTASPTSCVAGDLVTLDGSGSTDPNGDPLSYKWSFTSVPPGSIAAISDPAAAKPTFTPDLGGSYVAQLVVNDGYLPSDPVTTATIQVISQQTAEINRLQDCINYINELPCSVFKNCNMKKALVNKLNAVIADIEAGSYQDALSKLQHDILAKTDGVSLSNSPDKNDWIVDAPTNSDLYGDLQDIITKLQELMQP